MAGDWIKIRVWLKKDPKVIRMADHLAADPRFRDWIEDSIDGLRLRDVTVALCVTSLVIVWGTAREQGHRKGDDLLLDCCNAQTLDGVADLPGFGDAMASVGWILNREGGGIIFPKFFRVQQNTSERHKESNAARQKRYRERQREQGAGNRNGKVTGGRNVTSNVTSNDRGEERREDNTPLSPPKGGKRFVPPTLDEVKAYCLERGNVLDDPEKFWDFYESKGWKVGNQGMKDWRAAVRNWEKGGDKRGSGSGLRLNFDGLKGDYHDGGL